VPDTELESRVLDVLGDYQGIFQVQLIGAHLLDINPRVYGSLPLAVASGANLPAVYCDLLGGRKLEAPKRAEPGVRYRWTEGDARALAGGVRAHDLSMAEAVRALRPRRRTAHSLEDVRDLKPLLLRGYNVVRRLR